MLERIKVLASLTSVKPMDMARRGQACPDSWKPPRVLPCEAVGCAPRAGQSRGPQKTQAPQKRAQSPRPIQSCQQGQHIAFCRESFSVVPQRQWTRVTEGWVCVRRERCGPIPNVSPVSKQQVLPEDGAHLSLRKLPRDNLFPDSEALGWAVKTVSPWDYSVQRGVCQPLLTAECHWRPHKVQSARALVSPPVHVE